MKKHVGFAVKSGIFLLLLSVALLYMIEVFQYKCYFNVQWPSTSTCRGLYEMEPNSIDVLFLGSSHCMSSFNPQEIYDSYGLRSYNLGTEQQNLLISYFWLQEALRYQYPKVVVLDTFICFPYDAKNPINSSEAAARLALDPMKWSSVKVEAISAVCEYDKEQDVASYYNPLIRFHDRWSELSENDFAYFELSGHGEMKGYSLLSNHCGNDKYQPFKVESSNETAKMVPLMEEYLDKIVELCKENEIELILVKTPTTKTGIERYNCMSAYAQTHQIEYYDFNEESLYNEIGYHFSVDNGDSEHVNYWGAQKISAKIGEILSGDRYKILAVKDKQWERSREFYTAAVRNAELCHITDMIEYLEAIQQDRYTIFVAIMGDASNFMSKDVVEKMQQLGLVIDLTEEYQKSYYAVISPDSILEEVGEKALSVQGSFRDGRCIYNISSAGYKCGNYCSINLDNQEYAKRKRGLNIVVYDNVYRRVVDSICFDASADALDAIR